jgi:uncharacterized membrane protein YdjX (TVP38/TMEM64 family)
MKIDKEKISFFCMIVIMALMLFISHKTGIMKELSIDSLKVFILSKGWIAPLIFLLLYILTSISFLLPSALLSIVSGALWGPVLGPVITISAAVVSAIFPFYIARALGNSFMDKIFKSNASLNICDRFISKNGFEVVFVMRLIPFISWDMVNYGAGLCNIKFRDYMLGTLLGTIPGSVAYNIIGTQIGKPLNTIQLTMIALLAITSALMIFYLKRKS